jgi:homocysteine S-methyltransferase
MHKVEAGAEYLVTPPIFDIETFDPLLERLRGTGLPILAGLAVIDGLRHAEFLASEVVGVKIPETIFERLRQAKDEAGEALALTMEIADWLRSRVDGLQVTAWHGSPGSASRLLAALAARGTQEVKHA